MLTKSLILGFSLAALAAGQAYAADDKKADAQTGASATAGASAPQSFESLDTNKDGSIARAEAAAHGDLAMKFKEHDKDNDGKLSRAEYDAMGKAGAAAGATSGQSTSPSPASQKPAK
jgi:hypothetical protein